MSNYVPDVSSAVTFAIKTIAALDEYDVEALARELSDDPYDDLVAKLYEASITSHQIHGAKSLFAEVAEEYRRNRAKSVSSETDCDIPDFDDPDFEVKLYTDSAPLDDRKRLFVRLWDGFSTEDQRAFMSRVDPNGVFRRIVA
ncbi:hypothetical protein A8B74_07470 [Sulfitobacter geojensis]|nr:hypothetical protein A8B74_07470 [Sulfitobacter geojensis]